MRKLSLLLSLLGAILLAAPALAGSYCNGQGDDCNTDNSTTITNDSVALAGAVAGAMAGGGDAAVRNSGNSSSTSGVLGSGNSSSNSSATGIMGQMQGIADSGNSSSTSGLFGSGNSSSLSKGGDATQGQMQGNLGINGQKQGIEDSGNSEVGNGLGNFSPDASARVGDVRLNDGDVSTSTSTSTAQDQKQKQDQDVAIDQAFSDDDEINFDNSDHSVHSIDNDFPVNTAAPVFAGNCSQGVSAQTMSFGGSIASGNAVCDFIAVGGARIAAGDREGAFKAIDQAEDYAKWRSIFGKVRMVLTLGLL